MAEKQAKKAAAMKAKPGKQAADTEGHGVRRDAAKKAAKKR